MRVVFLTAICLLLATISVVGGGRCAVAAPPSTKAVQRELVVVSLRSTAQVDGRVIRLGDVAQVTGGDIAIRERVKALDLDDELRPGEALSITPPQVEFRLRLAGIDADDVSIRGTAVRVTARGTSSPHGRATLTSAVSTAPVVSRDASRAESPLERAVIKAAQDCVLARLPWKAEDVSIRLAQPLTREVGQADAASDYECRAELRTSGPAVGRVQVRVIAEAPRKPSIDVAVLLDVRHFDDVVLTTKALERGQTITAADVYVDRQDVTGMTDYCSRTDQLLGATAKRSVRALLPLRNADVESTAKSSGAILIKRRDRIKMNAKAGAINVTVMGEALQEGRAGETIRLRNIDSNTVVQGRVTSANEVEISF